VTIKPGAMALSRVQGSGFRVQGSGFRVQGSGFRVRGSGFGVRGSAETRGQETRDTRWCQIAASHVIL
jgi:hypothetical protein